MEKKARLIEILSIDGRLLLSLLFTEKEVTLKDDKTTPPKQRSETKGDKNQTNSQQNNDSLMTDAQKRYLFRILAEQGIEGDKAHEHLRKLFDVDTLKDVTKFEASRMIERLLSETKGGDNDAGSPF